VVVDAEGSKKTNKITRRSEWRGVQKKVCKKGKKDLTQPALPETKRHYQLGMVDQVREGIERANEKAYQNQ